MSYQHNFDINWAIAGETLNAQLVDASGANVGSPITTGIHDLGGGMYSLLATIPDGHQGSIVFYKQGDTSIKVGASINPRELENADIKSSAIASGSDPLHNVQSDYTSPELGYILGALTGVANPILTTPALTDSNNLILIKADDYLPPEPRTIVFTEPAINAWPDLDDGAFAAAANFEILKGDSDATPVKIIAAEITTATGYPKQITLSLTSADTADLPDTRYVWHLPVSLKTGHRQTLSRGRLLFATP